MFELDNLPPRSFSNTVLPTRADGTPFDACRNEEDYKFYVAWLADYLYETKIPLTPKQAAWLKTKPNSKARVYVAFWCSDSYAYAEPLLEWIDSFFEENKTYETFFEWERNYWEENTSPEDKKNEDFAFDPTSRETFDRLRREWQEMVSKGATEVTNRFADIPFRALLAWQLRLIHGPRKRRDEVDCFFKNFQDTANK